MRVSPRDLVYNHHSPVISLVHAPQGEGDVKETPPAPHFRSVFAFLLAERAGMLGCPACSLQILREWGSRQEVLPTEEGPLARSRTDDSAPALEPAFRCSPFRWQ